MKRYKHSLSHYKLTTMDMGKLVPVGCYEVLPGDSVQQATSALIRVNPLVAPVMHPVQVRIHHWFVPNRLIWEDWESFITGGTDGEGDGATWPYLANPTIGVGDQGDYFGLPATGAGVGNVSALPFRAYALIFNENYRDQDLVSEMPMSVASGADATTGATIASIAWEKDRFTSARPWPQKGPEVTLPLGTTAPVIPSGAGAKPTFNYDVLTNKGINVTGGSSAVVADQANAGATDAMEWNSSGLVADLSTATAVSVNAVREAFALQRFEEARAMYGSRYTEYLRYLGVRSSDARLQRPEYLGGGKQTIAFSEVLQTAPTTSGSAAGVADLKGHGIAAMRSRRYRRFFEEHGLVISLMSVRPRTIYRDGVAKMWFRGTKEDYWQKELEMIGQSEIYNRELYQFASPGDVFGYQDRYAEYRHLPSQVNGQFRSTLNYWHLARLFSGAQTLNSAFVTCDPSTRIYAASVTNGNLLCMVNHSIQARRPVTKTGTPGRII